MEAVCGSTAHERGAQVLSDPRNRDGGGPGEEPPLFLPTCFVSQKTQLETFCITGLRSAEGRPGRDASLEHTHKSPGPKKCLLLTRKKPLLRERVRLQKILPSPQTRRSGACLSRLDGL